MTTKDILIVAKALVENGEKDAWFAVNKAANWGDCREAKSALRGCGEPYFFDWCLSSDRKIEDIIAVFDRAIANEAEKEMKP